MQTPTRSHYGPMTGGVTISAAPPVRYAGSFLPDSSWPENKIRARSPHSYLGADLLGKRAHLCPRCRVDLTESVRGHLYSCAMLPENVHLRAREARDATAKLIRQNYQAADGADVLLREAEAAIAALRDTMRQLPSAR